MDLKTTQLIDQLRKNPAAAQKLFDSPDGKKLIALLTQDGGKSLQNASQQAAQGNPAEMAKMIRQLMQQPEGAALVERIRRQVEK